MTEDTQDKNKQQTQEKDNVPTFHTVDDILEFYGKAST